MVGITFDYNVTLPERKYEIREVIKVNGRLYRVRALGNKIVFLEETY